MNLSQTIVPKSDQLNADDLIAGPRTIRVVDVRAGSAEQPVAIYFEGDNGRPYKPGKSMRRILVALWGDDSTAYIGRRMTLFRDPDVRFGGDDVGGIRISHMSHITDRQTLALTVTRGKRKPYTVDPLPTEQPAVAQLVDLPEAWADWTTEQRGENRATKGTEAFRAWWKTLAKTEAAAISKATVDTWKETATKADANKQAA